MKLKDGVLWQDMHPSMWYARWVAELCCRKKAGRDCIITSARDGKHSTNSLHYVGKALDMRTRDLTDAQIQALAGELREWLGPDFDVVVERTHIHVEYDPKGYDDGPVSGSHLSGEGSSGSGRGQAGGVRQPPAQPQADSRFV